MAVLKIDDLDPDGVPVFIDWDAMNVGGSVFIPCINTSSAIKQCRKVFARRGWKIRISITTRNDILGVRIWRIA
jgi:ATP sulfurylase